MGRFANRVLHTVERGGFSVGHLRAGADDDEIAHVITPFTLVAITAESVYRFGGDDEFFDTPVTLWLREA
jgi:hypothetical protein